jgi:hypothetical protein
MFLTESKRDLLMEFSIIHSVSQKECVLDKMEEQMLASFFGSFS